VLTDGRCVWSADDIFAVPNLLFFGGMQLLWRHLIIKQGGVITDYLDIQVGRCFARFQTCAILCACNIFITVSASSSLLMVSWFGIVFRGNCSLNLTHKTNMLCRIERSEADILDYLGSFGSRI
jgi:hypothetical protein